MPVLNHAVVESSRLPMQKEEVKLLYLSQRLLLLGHYLDWNKYIYNLLLFNNYFISRRHRSSACPWIQNSSWCLFRKLKNELRRNNLYSSNLCVETYIFFTIACQARYVLFKTKINNSLKVKRTIIRSSVRSKRVNSEITATSRTAP